MGRTLPVFLIVLGKVKVDPRKSEILKACEWFYIYTRPIETGVVRILQVYALRNLWMGGKAMPLYEKLGVGIKIVLFICPLR